jgi:hypothetical protein
MKCLSENSGVRRRTGLQLRKEIMTIRFRRRNELLLVVSLVLSHVVPVASAQSSHGGNIVSWIRDLRSADFPAQVNSIQLRLNQACNPCVIDPTQKATIRGYWTIGFGSQSPTATWADAPWTFGIEFDLSCTDSSGRSWDCRMLLFTGKNSAPSGCTRDFFGDDLCLRSGLQTCEIRIIGTNGRSTGNIGIDCPTDVSFSKR